MWQLCLVALIVKCCIFTQLTDISKAEVQCNPPKRVTNFSADVIIGGLIPVHATKELTLNEPGVIWVEAMIFAIEEINNNLTLLPDVKLGYDIRDSCNKVDLASLAALDFMLTPSKSKNSYRDNFDSKNESSCFCNKIANHSISPVIAVVGGASSSISTTLSPLFSTDNIPQISYSSTSPALSNKAIYSTFFRTIPSDVYQAEAIADILEYFNWTYVSIVVSEDEYGRNGLYALGKMLKLRNFCIAEEASFSTKEDMDRIIQRLQDDTRQRVVVLWCGRPKAIEFLKEATGKLSNITWIGTESWGDNKDVLKEVDFNLIKGMLGVLPYLGRHEKFDAHLKTLTPNSKQTNPWLSEYWQKVSKKCAESHNNCTDEELPNAYSLPLNKYANVMDAVYAIAHGLQNLKKSHPNLNISRINKEMLKELVKHIKEVNFHARSTKGKFNFTSDGDPNFGAYLIKNLQSNTTNKGFVSIAQWNGETSKLEFEQNVKIQWNQGGINQSVPLSRCSETCQAGFGFVGSSKKCCWSCPKCQARYYKPNVGKLAPPNYFYSGRKCFGNRKFVR